MMNERGQVVHVVEDTSNDTMDESLANVGVRSNRQIEDENEATDTSMPMPVVSHDGRLVYLIP